MSSGGSESTPHSPTFFCTLRLVTLSPIADCRAKQGRSAGDEDARVDIHDASAVISDETSSRNGKGRGDSQPRWAGSYSFCGS